MKRFDIITIFPEIIAAYANESILARAAKRKLIKIAGHDLRRWTRDRRRTVDDKPFGGGPGMVLAVEPIARAVSALRGRNKRKARVILFSTRGKEFSQAEARRLAKYDQLILICGRYEGVDERVAEHIADEELSLGPFVLSGGELPALVVVDAVSRQIPGVLGKQESLEEIKGSFPQYTRPREAKLKIGKRTIAAKVPEVLLSGDHKKIAAWRKKHS
ncbi:tRNA (guanosine(37)-N1)-methyltransferase TrmD [Patescibacteria group bacterium]|nr:MAG: tRNA (guanosine(37)-N1)-methyltransferase TrmD [Patescibacteria group bacterium]